MIDNRCVYIYFCLEKIKNLYGVLLVFKVILFIEVRSMAMKSTKWLTIFGTVLLCLFVVYLGQCNYLSNPEMLQLSLKAMGPIAPLVFILIQMIQVIIPIIPGGVSSGIGVIVFGPVEGFIYNYLGLLVGSYVVFKIVKKYGKNFILKVTDKKTYEKYIGWLDKGKKFEVFFAFAILLPGMPDDLLCMIAGLTGMSTKKYMLINILCKPAGLILYSFGIKELLVYLGRLFSL